MQPQRLNTSLLLVVAVLGALKAGLEELVLVVQADFAQQLVWRSLLGLQLR
jgi:hypothetical protein